MKRGTWDGKRLVIGERVRLELRSQAEEKVVTVEILQRMSEDLSTEPDNKVPISRDILE